MIVPFLDGFLSFTKAPITWLLILFNVFSFFQSYKLSKNCQSQLARWYGNETFLHTQGRIYKQYGDHEGHGVLNRAGNMEMLGGLAFQDQTFLDLALKKSWEGDQIAIVSWKQSLSEFLSLRAYYPPTILGMSDFQKDFFSVISYQFYHENFFHLLGNLLLILLVAGFLENRHSGFLVFSVYLLGGGFAAICGVAHPSGIPLVGASGSLSALFGFLMVTHWSEKTRLFYLLLPLRRAMGFVWIPTCYWIVWFCILEDMAGWLAQPSIYLSGVAHLVHLFGFLAGGFMGTLFLLVCKNFPSFFTGYRPQASIF